MWGSVLQVVQPKAKQIPKVMHTHFTVLFGDSAFHFSGEADAGPKCSTVLQMAVITLL